MKKCNYCKEMKENKDFYRNKRTKDGLFYFCKNCAEEYVRKREAIRKGRFYGTLKSSEL